MAGLKLVLSKSEVSKQCLNASFWKKTRKKKLFTPHSFRNECQNNPQSSCNSGVSAVKENQETLKPPVKHIKLFIQHAENKFLDKMQNWLDEL